MASEDYAGKGIAGSALGLGIAGTALALLGNSGGLGGLGGLFGGGNSVAAATQSAIDLEGERRLARLEAKVEAQSVTEAKDAQIEALRTQLSQSQTLRYIDDKTANMITGSTYLSPTSMADPYVGTPQVLESYPVFDPASSGGVVPMYGRGYNRGRGRRNFAVPEIDIDIDYNTGRSFGRDHDFDRWY